jgi:hypothetical protein
MKSWPTALQAFASEAPSFHTLGNKTVLRHGRVQDDGYNQAGAHDWGHVSSTDPLHRVWQTRCLASSKRYWKYDASPHADPVL